MFGDPDGGGVHGPNQRIRVTSLYNGRDFLQGLVKIYAMQDKFPASPFSLSCKAR